MHYHDDLMTRQIIFAVLGGALACGAGFIAQLTQYWLSNRRRDRDLLFEVLERLQRCRRILSESYANGSQEILSSREFLEIRGNKIQIRKYRKLAEEIKKFSNMASSSMDELDQLIRKISIKISKQAKKENEFLEKFGKEQMKEISNEQKRNKKN